MPSYLTPTAGPWLRPAAASLLVPAFAALLLLCDAAHGATTDEQTQLRQIAQLAEYVGVDYVEAVDDGRVIDAGEYQEMIEFSALIAEKLALLRGTGPEYQSLENQAIALQEAIAGKRDVAAVRAETSSLRRAILALMPALSFPSELLPQDSTERLFQTNCTGCHGVSGQGDGPVAAGLEPAPTDFTDLGRAENRSILGLFDAISNGIDDTAMASFGQLSEQERWSLAFYSGSLAFRSAPQWPDSAEPAVTLQQMVNQSPSQLSAELTGINRADIDGLRANPALLFTVRKDPLSVTRAQLRAALAANQQGDYSKASDLAVSAYLDGFELIENSLDTRDEALRRSLEAQLMTLRQALGQAQQGDELDSLMASTLSQLDEAESLLNASNLSGGTLFAASFVILLREGLEALLVIIALVTVLVRTQRHDVVKYVHFGWIGALLAGAATWAAAQSLISISGAGREVMEGVAALLAAVVLFYVGVWMHSKTHAAHWQAYIKKHIETRLKSGALWGLAALAFIAVYREVFETVLFYQSLLTQAVTSQYSYVAGGLLAGVAVLLVLAWLLARYSIKLPLKTFFASTTYLLLALSFVLMGKAVTALQEAAVIGISPLPVSFDFDWIGVKSTWQGVLAQGAILIGFTVFVFRSRSKAAVN